MGCGASRENEYADVRALETKTEKAPSELNRVAIRPHRKLEPVAWCGVENKLETVPVSSFSCILKCRQTVNSHLSGRQYRIATAMYGGDFWAQWPVEFKSEPCGVCNFATHASTKRYCHHRFQAESYRHSMPLISKATNNTEFYGDFSGQLNTAVSREELARTVKDFLRDSNGIAKILTFEDILYREMKPECIEFLKLFMRRIVQHICEESNPWTRKFIFVARDVRTYSIYKDIIQQISQSLDGKFLSAVNVENDEYFRFL